MTAMTKAAVEVTAPAGGVPYSALDTVFFVVGGVSAVWLTSLLAQASFQWGWAQVWFLFIFWALLAYLVLPRLHRILTRLYVPDYFIGRARTSDGLLGDPVNVALLGAEPQVHAVMQAAGWTLADDVTLASSRRIVSSTLLRRSYLEAPVSPLFLFGRQQDFAYQQEVDGTPGKRHHVRFWRCPPGWLLPGGLAVDWLAAGTYDRSVGLSLFTLQITHKIAENTDAERDHVVGAITGADPAAAVRVIRDFSTGYHSRNGGGDTISTDGDLPIVDLTRTAGASAASVWPAERQPQQASGTHYCRGGLRRCPRSGGCPSGPVHGVLPGRTCGLMGAVRGRRGCHGGPDGVGRLGRNGGGPAFCPGRDPAGLVRVPRPQLGQDDDHGAQHGRHLHPGRGCLPRRSRHHPAGPISPA